MATLHNKLKTKILQKSFESRFIDFAKEEHCILAFINSFLQSEESILKVPSNIPIEFIELKKKLLLKKKYVELPSSPNDSDIINFLRSLPCKQVSE